jgi:hypothetical protein
VTTSVVVGSIFLTSDQLFYWKKKKKMKGLIFVRHLFFHHLCK